MKKGELTTNTKGDIIGCHPFPITDIPHIIWVANESISLNSKKALETMGNNQPQPRVYIRNIGKNDAVAIYNIVKNCPPLELNSLYCYGLLALHFEETCLLAEVNGHPIGFVSGYLIPNQPDVFFVWQIGVLPEHRGGKASILLLDQVKKIAIAKGCCEIQCTIEPNNHRSKKLFGRLALQCGGELINRGNLSLPSAFSQEYKPETIYGIRLNAPLSN